jgi:hypothetical protein
MQNTPQNAAPNDPRQAGRRLVRLVMIFAIAAMVVFFLLSFLQGEPLPPEMFILGGVWMAWALYMVFASPMLKGK